MDKSAHENAALVRRFLIDIVGGGDTDAIDVLVSNELAEHNLLFGNSHDQAGVNSLGWRVLSEADVSADVDDVVARENRVAVRGRLTGIHSERWMNLPPTENEFEIAYIWFCRVKDGRITEIWSLPDGLGFLQQVGAVPANFESDPNRNPES